MAHPTSTSTSTSARTSTWHLSPRTLTPSHPRTFVPTPSHCLAILPYLLPFLPFFTLSLFATAAILDAHMAHHELTPSIWKYAYTYAYAYAYAYAFAFAFAFAFLPAFYAFLRLVYAYLTPFPVTCTLPAYLTT